MGGLEDQECWRFVQSASIAYIVALRSIAYIVALRSTAMGFFFLFGVFISFLLHEVHGSTGEQSAVWSGVQRQLDAAE